jgi:hypothetical protein
MLDASVTLVSPLGATVQVPFRVNRTEDVPQRLLEVLRDFGGRGYSSPIPAGGYRLPLANADDFDWRLIGARPGTKVFRKEGGGTETKPGVWHGGQFYTRREGEEVDGPRAKMPHAVWYSRGTSGTEPPGTVVETAGNNRYVRLITFRGDSKKVGHYALPPARRSQSRASS